MSKIRLEELDNYLDNEDNYQPKKKIKKFKKKDE